MTRLEVLVMLGERASAALGLPRNDCVDACARLLPDTDLPPRDTETLRAVAGWVLSDEDAMAALRSLGGDDPLCEVRRWGGH